MLKTSIINPDDGVRQRIEPTRAALVSQRPVPPFGAPLDAIIFRSFLEDSAGSNDMAVLASPIDPALFSVTAVQGADIYIKSMSFAITGPSMELGEFGDLPPLSNGCIFTYETQTDRVVLADDIVTNFNLMRLGGELMPGVGDTTTGLKVGAPLIGQASDDLYLAYIDFHRVYGFPWGLRIAADSEQRLDFIIQDDLSAIPLFNATVFGFLRGEDTERS